MFILISNIFTVCYALAEARKARSVSNLVATQDSLHKMSIKQDRIIKAWEPGVCDFSVYEVKTKAKKKVRKRARNKAGKFVADDPLTKDRNEAYENKFKF